MAVVKTDTNSFKQTIESGVTLVDFYADWCGPCKMIAPVLEQVAGEMPDLTIAKLNVDNSPEIASQFGVMSIPTLILFKDGNQVAQTMGFQPKEMLKKWIESNQ
jgi:thioredoxin 1